MDADLAAGGGGRWWGGPTHAVAAATSTDVMNQLCRVCGEPAAGFHFGAFTCEGCKSFFGRTYNNLSSISECKNNGGCVINKKNRTSCKACRLRKCLMVGMSKSGSRYGRRSNWFKIHCLLQEQQQQSQQHQQYQQQQQHQQHPQSKNKPWDTGPPPLSKTIEDNNNHLVKHPMGLLSPHPAFPHPGDAAAFWAARASLMHPPSLPHLPMPFLAPPSFLSAAYRPPPRPLLLPFVHATPHPSTSSTSSASSSASSPSPPERLPPAGEAALQALGPVQEQPIDLSLGSGGAGERQVVDERSVQSDSSDSELEEKVDEEDKRKATTPLDLTFKT